MAIACFLWFNRAWPWLYIKIKKFFKIVTELFYQNLSKNKIKIKGYRLSPNVYELIFQKDIKKYHYGNWFYT